MCRRDNISYLVPVALRRHAASIRVQRKIKYGESEIAYMFRVDAISHFSKSG